MLSFLYRWNPKFDSFILEEQYWKSTFPRTTIRFQFGLLYLLLLLIGLAIYFPAKQVLCDIIFVLNFLDDYLLNRAKINPISIQLFDRLKTSMLFWMCSTLEFFISIIFISIKHQAFKHFPSIC